MLSFDYHDFPSTITLFPNFSLGSCFSPFPPANFDRSLMPLSSLSVSSPSGGILLTILLGLRTSLLFQSPPPPYLYPMADFFPPVFPQGFSFEWPLLSLFLFLIRFSIFFLLIFLDLILFSDLCVPCIFGR